VSEATKDPGDLHTVAGQTLWNLAGMILPMAVAVVAIPMLIEHLGKERFGALGIIGLLIGYLSVFDMGIGQALAYLVADCRGRGQQDHIPSLFQTAILLVIGIGFLLATGFFFAAGPLVSEFLKVPPELQAEIRLALRCAAFAIPLAILAPCLVSTLEAFQDFRRINLIRIPTSASYFLAPLAVIPFTDTLPPVILAIAVGRIFETTAFFLCCLRHIPHPFRHLHFSAALCLRLLRFGGWMTLSNILLPLMIHGDRFILGAMGTLVLVTYYITPAEVIVRLLVLPRALVTVLFPNLTIRFASQQEGAEALLAQCLRLLLGALTFGVALLVCFGPWALGLWLGPEYRGTSGTILRWLSLGVLFLSLAYVPLYMIQASGRPRLPALLHLMELPLYIGLAIFGVTHGGAIGIAMAWALRAAIDLVLMLRLATLRLPALRHELAPLLGRIALASAFLLALVLLPDPDTFPVAGIPLCLAAAALVWFVLLGAQERRLILSPLCKGLRQ